MITITAIDRNTGRQTEKYQIVQRNGRTASQVITMLRREVAGNDNVRYLVDIPSRATATQGGLSQSYKHYLKSKH